jgi:hypothetical protein
MPRSFPFRRVPLLVTFDPTGPKPASDEMKAKLCRFSQVVAGSRLNSGATLGATTGWMKAVRKVVPKGHVAVRVSTPDCNSRGRPCR